MKEIKDKSWILYIAIPLFMCCLVICATLLYLNSHPYPIKISMNMDNNTYNSIKLIYANNSKSNETLSYPNCENYTDYNGTCYWLADGVHTIQGQI